MKLKRKLILLVVLVMIVGTLGGCKAQIDIVDNPNFTFSEERFDEFLLELGEVARSDIENKVKRYDKNAKELDKDPLRQEYFYYHDYPLTDLQKERLDTSIELSLSANLYVICGSTKNKDDDVWIRLFQDSLKYAEKVNKDYTLLDLINP